VSLQISVFIFHTFSVHSAFNSYIIFIIFYLQLIKKLDENDCIPLALCEMQAQAGMGSKNKLIMALQWCVFFEKTLTIAFSLFNFFCCMNNARLFKGQKDEHSCERQTEVTRKSKCSNLNVKSEHNPETGSPCSTHVSHGITFYGRAISTAYLSTSNSSVCAQHYKYCEVSKDEIVNYMDILYTAEVI